MDDYGPRRDIWGITTVNTDELAARPGSSNSTRRELWRMLESCDGDTFRTAVAMMHEGMNNSQIGKELGYDHRRVQSWRLEAGLPKHGRDTYPDEVVRMAVRLVRVNKIRQVEVMDRIFEKFGKRPSEGQISKWVRASQRTCIAMDEHGKADEKIRRHIEPFPLAAMRN